MHSAAPQYTIGWVYNLHTAPEATNAGKVIAIATSFSAIALLCIIIRLVIRGRLLKAIGLDDVSAAASMLLGIAYSAIAIYRSYRTEWPHRCLLISHVRDTLGTRTER